MGASRALFTIPASEKDAEPHLDRLAALVG